MMVSPRIINLARLTGGLCLLPLVLTADPALLISSPGPILLEEDFSEDELPSLFTVGVGDWTIVDGKLRGRQLAADRHTAFRKIFLDHQDVIYAFDLKLESEAFSQILINYDLVHVAKCVTRLDGFEILKVMEGKKRRQMAELERDQGLDPLQGDWDEKTHALDQANLNLRSGQWYRVTIELIGDRMAMQIDGQQVQGRHSGLTEKKTNFGFQAGGLEGYVYYDNVVVRAALPQTSP